jgi:hypothetical protein
MPAASLSYLPFLFQGPGVLGICRRILLKGVVLQQNPASEARSQNKPDTWIMNHRNIQETNKASAVCLFGNLPMFFVDIPMTLTLLTLGVK